MNEKLQQQKIYESFRSGPFEDIVARSEAKVSQKMVDHLICDHAFNVYRRSLLWATLLKIETSLAFSL